MSSSYRARYIYSSPKDDAQSQHDAFTHDVRRHSFYHLLTHLLLVYSAVFVLTVGGICGFLLWKKRMQPAGTLIGPQSDTYAVTACGIHWVEAWLPALEEEVVVSQHKCRHVKQNAVAVLVVPQLATLASCGAAVRHPAEVRRLCGISPSIGRPAFRPPPRLTAPS